MSIAKSCDHSVVVTGVRVCGCLLGWLLISFIIVTAVISRYLNKAFHWFSSVLVWHTVQWGLLQFDSIFLASQGGVHVKQMHVMFVEWLPHKIDIVFVALVSEVECKLWRNTSVAVLHMSCHFKNINFIKFETEQMYCNLISNLPVFVSQLEIIYIAILLYTSILTLKITTKHTSRKLE